MSTGVKVMDTKVFSVEDLVGHVLAGKVRIPHFQRRLRWELPEVKALFQSIIDGVPLGTLLFWQRPAPAAVVGFTGEDLRVSGLDEAWWVVDGQQRLNALGRVLAGRDWGQEPFALFYDVRTRAFERPRPRQTPPPHWLPMRVVLDELELHGWVDAQPLLTADDKKAAFQVAKSVRRAQVPASILVGDDEQAVRSIFKRANTSGKAMLEHEVFDALYGSSSERQPGLATREVLAAISSVGFGTFSDDDDLVITTLKGIAGWDIGVAAPDTTATDAERLYERTQRGLERAISFLRERCGVPRLEVLPYQHSLVLLSVLFDRLPDLHPRNEELVARMMWRGWVHGAFAAGNAFVRRLITLIDPADEAKTIQSLLRQVPDSHLAAPMTVGQFRFNHADSKLVTLALHSLHPAMGRGMAPESADLESLYPPLQLWKKGDGIGVVGNRFLHHWSGPEFLGMLDVCARFEDLIPTEPGCLSGDAFLKSHGVVGSAAEALRLGDRAGFLAHRSDHIHQVLNDLIERRCAFDASDRPPLRSLEISAEAIALKKTTA